MMSGLTQFTYQVLNELRVYSKTRTYGENFPIIVGTEKP
jgi:hypothetical protein